MIAVVELERVRGTSRAVGEDNRHEGVLAPGGVHPGMTAPAAFSGTFADYVVDDVRAQDCPF